MSAKTAVTLADETPKQRVQEVFIKPPVPLAAVPGLAPRIPASATHFEVKHGMIVPVAIPIASAVHARSRETFAEQANPAIVVKASKKFALGVSRAIHRMKLSAYVPNNGSLYNAAISGFLSGVFLAVDLIDPVASDYNAIVNEAATFAQAVDEGISAGSPSVAQVDLVSQLSQSLMANKYTLNMPVSSFALAAGAIAACLIAASEVFVSVVPIPPGGFVFTETLLVGDSGGASGLATFAVPTGVSTYQANCTARVIVSGGALEALGDAYDTVTPVCWYNPGSGSTVSEPFQQGQVFAFGQASMNQTSFGPAENSALLGSIPFSVAGLDTSTQVLITITLTPLGAG